MKWLVLIFFVFSSIPIIGQKKYDCIIFIKPIDSSKADRLIGTLGSIDDSSLVLVTNNGEIKFLWNELKEVVFRKHNGFIKNFAPIPLILGGVAFVGIGVPNTKTSWVDASVTSAVLVILSTII